MNANLVHVLTYCGGYDSPFSSEYQVFKQSLKTFLLPLFPGQRNNYVLQVT